MREFNIEQWPEATVISRLDEISEIYADVYSEPPYNSGKLWSIPAFIRRTSQQASREGFTFLAALIGDQMAGFSFGIPFAPGAWWTGDATDPPEDLRTAAKFAVIELVVQKAWRRIGIGHRLLNQLLAERREPYAILTAMPTAEARRMYERWGWVQTGTAHHTPESPILDALALPLGSTTIQGPTSPN